MARGPLLTEAKRYEIKQAFEANGGNVFLAAQVCGVSHFSAAKVLRAAGLYVSIKRAPRSDIGKVRGPYAKPSEPRKPYESKWVGSGFIAPLTPEQMMVRRA